LLGLLLDLAILAASITTGGPVSDGIRAIGIIVAAVVGALGIFAATVLTIAVLDQGKAPFPMVGDRP
jgi:hypothetical protein